MSVRQGTNLIASGTIPIDGNTISFNGNASLQANGVINKNTEIGATNPIYDWVGTLAEYTAQNIVVDHPDWLCFITDDYSSDYGLFANIDASNFTTTGTTFLSEQTMPSPRSEEVTLLASGSTYTAPGNGLFCFYFKCQTSGNKVTITNNTRYTTTLMVTSVMAGTVQCVSHWCRKGDVIKLSWSSTAINLSGSSADFIYAVGNPGGQ